MAIWAICDPLSWENATGCFIDIGREIPTGCKSGQVAVSSLHVPPLSNPKLTKDLANFGDL